VERLLQVGLDLGVVRGQDPMAGVGRLAVDRPAAPVGTWQRRCLLLPVLGQSALGLELAAAQSVASPGVAAQVRYAGLARRVMEPGAK
jgi:hypothetical protein